MKRKDFERLGKALLAKLPGFAAKGQLLLAQPVGHTLRAVCFDGSSFDAQLFFVHVFVQPLYVPADHVVLSLGWRIGGESHRWDRAAPDLEATLGSALRQEALPFLTRIRSPLDVAAAIRQLRNAAEPYAQQAIAYSFARAGDAAQARASLADLLPALRAGRYPWQREMAERVEWLHATLDTGPESAQRQLDAWEAATAAKLGLQKYR